MAQTVIWSKESLDDIDNIAQYISRDSLYHAQQVVEHILNVAISCQSSLSRGAKYLN